MVDPRGDVDVPPVTDTDCECGDVFSVYYPYPVSDGSSDASWTEAAVVYDEYAP